MIELTEHINMFKESIKTTSESTIKAYTLDINKFIEHIQKDNIRFDRVLQNDLNSYLFLLNIKPSTIKRKYHSIKSFYKYLVSENIISEYPFLNYRPNTDIIINKPMVLNKSQTEMLRNYMLEMSARDKLIFTLLLDYGLRLFELEIFKKKYVCKEYNYFNIKDRIIPIKEYTKHIFNNYINCLSEETEYLFINRLGNKMSEQSIRHLVKSVGKELEINKLTTKILRNTFAFNLTKQKISLDSYKNLLGVGSITTINRYL